MRKKGNPSCGCRKSYQSYHEGKCLIYTSSRLHTCTPSDDPADGWRTLRSDAMKRFDDWLIYFVDLDLEGDLTEQLKEYRERSWIDGDSRFVFLEYFILERRTQNVVIVKNGFQSFPANVW